MARGRHSRPHRAWTIVVVVGALVLTAAGVAVGAARWRSSAPQAAKPPSHTAATSEIDSRPASSAVAAWAVAAITTAPADPSVAATVAGSALATATAQQAALVPPPLPVFSAKRYLGKPVRVVPNHRREVALTFDDGPGDYTGEVLDILRERKVHATFFVIGMRAKRHESAVREMAAQGHEVENHTWNHPEPHEISETALAEQFDRTAELITRLTGRAPLFARTRGGKFTQATMDNLESRGIILALWNIHSNDVEPSPSPDRIVSNATSGASPGSIILMHETNPNTVKALPAILDALRRKGLHPVTLSQLLADDARVRE